MKLRRAHSAKGIWKSDKKLVTFYLFPHNKHMGFVMLYLYCDGDWWLCLVSGILCCQELTRELQEVREGHSEIMGGWDQGTS